MSTSSFGRLPSGENGDRQGIIQNNPVTRISGRKLQRKRPPTNQLRFQGKRCRYDFPFSCPTKGTSPSNGGREVAVFRPELADNHTRPMGSTDHTGLRNRTVKPSSANQPPFPPVLSPPQTSLVQEEIISLLQKRAIIEVAFNPWVGFYSNLFLVEKKGGSGQRPVINLSRFNNYVEYCHFKMEDLKAVAYLLRPGDFMCKLNLKDAYFSVPLHRRSQKFIRFQFQGRTYQFTCLPFGLTSAPRNFTKIFKPVTGILRKIGIRIIVYLHDMLIMNSTLEGARKDIMILKSILENLGFLINMKKSIFVPVQIVEFLGIIVDSTTMRFLLPDKNVAVIQKECRHLVSSQVTSLSQLSHNREVNFLQNCSSSSPSSLSGDPTFEEQQHASPGSQQRRNTFGSSCPTRPQVVVRQSLPGKWTPHSEFPSTSNDSIRCLQFGVGSCEQWGRHQGNLDKGGIKSSYQLQRATSSIICSESIHQRAAKCPCVDSNRQYNYHCLYQ